MAKKAVKRVMADYPHIESKRNVKIWAKKDGKSFQLSVEGIGGRFYGSWGRKADGSTIGELLSGKVSKPATKDIEALVRKAVAQALKNLL